MSTTWQDTDTDTDRLWTAVVIGVLALLLAIGVLDRAADTINVERTITGTVIADDPDSAATTTSVPDGGSR